MAHTWSAGWAKARNPVTAQRFRRMARAKKLAGCHGAFAHPTALGPALVNRAGTNMVNPRSGRPTVVSGRFPGYCLSPTSKTLVRSDGQAAEHRTSDERPRRRTDRLGAAHARGRRRAASPRSRPPSTTGSGGAFIAAVDLISAARGRRDRHRHGQVRPRRAQDRGDLRLDRHAGLLRASERGEPRRPRHDHARRRHHGAVVVGRDRRAQGPDRLFAPLPHRADRHHRRRRQHARPAPPTWCWRCRRRARPARTISRRPPRR